MIAIIKTGGKQYRVSEGETLSIESLSAAPGDEVEFNEVLFVVDGDQIEIGKPYVDGATVTAKVIEHGRGKKIRVIKFKRRKHYRKQMGHRQNFTKVEITAIGKG